MQCKATLLNRITTRRHVLEDLPLCLKHGISLLQCGLNSDVKHAAPSPVGGQALAQHIDVLEMRHALI